MGAFGEHGCRHECRQRCLYKYGWCGVTLTVAVIADDKSGKVR